MKKIRCIRQLILILFIGLGLGLAAQSQADNPNRDVQNLNKNKGGKCPCYDDEDLDDMTAGGTAECSYSFNVDRRLALRDPSAVPVPGPQQVAANAYVRTNLACYGPKVIPGTGTGLPGVGSYAIKDNKEGNDCFNKIIKAANRANLICECVTNVGGVLTTVDCPDSL